MRVTDVKQTFLTTLSSQGGPPTQENEMGSSVRQERICSSSCRIKPLAPRDESLSLSKNSAQAKIFSTVQVSQSCPPEPRGCRHPSLTAPPPQGPLLSPVSSAQLQTSCLNCLLTIWEGKSSIFSPQSWSSALFCVSRPLFVQKWQLTRDCFTFNDHIFETSTASEAVFSHAITLTNTPHGVEERICCFLVCHTNSFYN